MENISLHEELILSPIADQPKEFSLLSDPRIKEWLDKNAHLQPVQVEKAGQVEYFN